MFKKLTALFFILPFSFSVFGQDNLSPKQLLTEMLAAQNKLNYEISYVQIAGAEIDTYRYRHVYNEGKSYAQLATLEGGKQEIIQRDNLISYFHSNYSPFSIRGSQIIDNLPNIVNADFSRIEKHYDFINMGRNRIADRLVQTVRILPKDNFRYQYVVFIEEKTHLLLGSDMLDQDGNLLERFRVVNFYIDDQMTQPLTDALSKLPTPPVLDKATPPKNKLSWQAGWLPQGFAVLNNYLTKTDEDTIESRLYSDGLFSFTIYVSNNILPENQENVWKQGSFTIYSESMKDKEVTIIGQIPLTTAKRIVQEIKSN
ncbi:sigma-E factor regulatory protein RseB [Basfia succiniciproducens]|nr:sigma-E factor regulatory protein RseB [[Mannheimia] succiniciproducens]